MSIKTLRERGDTIVEVIIAILIMSVALSGAYVTTQSSLIDEEQANERSEAVQLLQAQLEALRNLALNGSSQIPVVSGSYFCIYTDAATNTSNVVDFSSAPPNSYSPTAYPGDCQLNSDGQLASASDQPSFSIALVVKTGGTIPTYTATANWYGPANVGTMSSELLYQVEEVNGG